MRNFTRLEMFAIFVRPYQRRRRKHIAPFFHPGGLRCSMA